MAWDWLIFVSKRLQRAVVAVLCIMTAQAAVAISTPHSAEAGAPPNTGQVVRIHIGN